MSGEALHYYNNFSSYSYLKRYEDWQKKEADQPAQIKASEQPAAQKVTPSEDAQGGQDNSKNQNPNLNNKDTFTNQQIREKIVESAKFIEKYKNNPQDAINDDAIKVKFEAQDAGELTELLKDEQNLALFLHLGKYEKLKGSDVVAGIKKFDDYRVKVKLPFSNISIGKISTISEEDFAKQMDEFRNLRRNMESEDLADISGKVTKKPELHDHTKMIVAKRNVYQDKDAVEAIKYAYENDKKAEGFFNGLTALEENKTELGTTKFDGSTIVSVSKDIAETPKSAKAILDTAKLSDISPEHLRAISKNISQNPIMTDGYEKLLNLKDEEGNNRFNANDLLAQTNFLSDKNKKEINTYVGQTLNLSTKYKDLTGKEIDSYAQKLTNNPSQKKSIYKDIAKARKAKQETIEKLYKPQETEEPVKSSEQQASTSSNKESTKTVEIRQTSVTSDVIVQAESVTTINKATVPKEFSAYGTTVQKQITTFKTLFGSDADKAIEIFKDSPELVAIIKSPTTTINEGMRFIKKYGNNKAVLKAISKNKNLVAQLTATSANITNDQLGELAELCNKHGSDVILRLLSKFNASKAISIGSSLENESSKQAVLRLLNDSQVDPKERDNKLEEITENNNSVNV